MRLSSLVFPLAAFVGAGALSLLAASFSVQLVEDSSVVGVRRALDEASLSWADADANGLQLFLIGTAPSEADRFRAVSVAGSVVDAARVLDQMNVADSADLAPPRFSVEILRNDSGISLIGLIPAGSNRQALLRRMHGIAGEENVSDLLDVADYPSPDTWDDALSYALRALEKLPRSKISIDADRVMITAMTDSPDMKRKLESELAKSSPEGVRLALDISAPRPVITPFTLRFLIDGDGQARFDACSADTETARDQILRAARTAGLEGKGDCRIGLGVPSRNWAAAVKSSITALKEVGGGSLTFSDADVSIIAPEGTDQALFDRVMGDLEAKLPDVFALEAVLPVTPNATDQGPPEFLAILSPEGQVQLRGRVDSEASRQLADSFAKARFGVGTVYTAARVHENMPQGWSIRVLAALESLSLLSNGAITVTPDMVTVSGNTGNPDASSQIAQLLAEKLGAGEKFDIDVTYKESLDPISEQPTPEECESTLQAVVADRKINFEPGSDKPDAEARVIIDDIADILKECGDLKLEIGGHTDSQGREIMNQQLSQARAQAVLNELRNRRVLVSSFTAKGYGETQPIADNDTDEGREANRRIEFKLIRPEPVKEVETTLESVEQSVEEDADAAAEDTATDEQN